MGTSEFAVPVLSRVAALDHDLRLVVTAPDRPKGRGRKVESPPIAKLSRDQDLPLFQPASVNAPHAIETLRAAEPELIVVVAYGQILGRSVLALPKRAIVNLHGSLLPRWRGAAPIARAIQAGDQRTGVTLQHVVQKVDAGDVIDAVEMEIGPNETAGDLSDRMALEAATLLEKNLPGLEAGTAPRASQPEAGATYAKTLSKEDGVVPWELPARKVHDHIRAMTPWPGAFTRLPVDDAMERVVLRRTEALDTGAPTAMPGTVLRAESVIEVATGYGSLRIQRLLRAGRKEMDTSAFLRGCPIKIGTRLQ